VTSPPYWKVRDYWVDGQMGLEPTVDEYLDRIVQACNHVRTALSPRGTMWWNQADAFNGTGGAGGDYNAGGDRHGQAKYGGRRDPRLKPKDLFGIPFQVVLRLQRAGWWWRQTVIWDKGNSGGNRDSAMDRPRTSHEYVFLLTKTATYRYFQAQEHLRTVWRVTPSRYKGAHFATMPVGLATRCIAAGCPPGGTVLDPFGGVGTTSLAAETMGCNSIMFELNPDYARDAKARIEREHPGANVSIFFS
jgi:site-specific DNA-methyltransferase (cytosine-N4-specific)